MTHKIFLGTHADIANKKTWRVPIGTFRAEPSLCVVREGENFYAYHNQCPHTGAPMDWQAGVFLDFEEKYIQCTIHGALFEIADGRCIFGPCAGQFLRSVPLKFDEIGIWAEL